MKKIAIHTQIRVFDSLEELPKTVLELMNQAIVAREKAYAPYSNFKVGAAILLENGKIVAGNNQENAAYPSGLCAERVALFFAGAQYPESKIKQLVVTARSENKSLQKPIPPCGACRQAIAEYEIKQQQAIQIYFMGETGQIYLATSIEDLLPFTFDPKNL